MYLHVNCLVVRLAKLTRAGKEIHILVTLYCRKKFYEYHKCILYYIAYKPQCYIQ